MAIREELELDLSRALSQVDDLERQLDSLLQPVELPITVSQQATQSLRDLDQSLAGIESGVSEISADLSLMEAAAGNAEIDVRRLAQALGVSEDEASQMVAEFSEATLEARELEAATREVAQALQLSEEDARDLARQMSRAASETDQVTASSRGAAGGVGLLGGSFRSLITTVGAYVGAREFINFARDSINAASDLEESLSKTEVVFGDFAGEVTEFAATGPQALGLSNQAALEATATFGNLFVALGLTQDAAADLSPEIVQLGADLASFNNIAVDEALTALRSGLVGEVEPLRRLGVAINAAAVEAKALELGLAGSTGEISEAAKVQARYALILEQTTTAQGDFARTADGIANRQRTLSANFENLQASIGAALLPAFESLVDAGGDLIPLIEDLAPVIGAAAEAAVGFVEPILLLADGLGVIVQPITDVAEALKDVEDVETDGLEDLSQATQNLIDPTDSVLSLFDELATFLDTGLDTATIRDGFLELNRLIQAGVSPVEALQVAYENLDAQGTVTEEVLRGLLEVAGATEEELAGFLAAQLLTEENLGTREAEALRVVLDELTVSLGIARGNASNFPRGRNVAEFAENIEAVERAVQRSEFERIIEGFGDTESAADDARDAIDGFLEAQLALVDPAFTALRAQENLAEAQEKLQQVREDDESTVADLDRALRGLATAQAEANAAVAAAPDDLDGAAAAAQRLLEQAGATADDIDRLRESVLSLDGLQAFVDIFTRFQIAGSADARAFERASGQQPTEVAGAGTGGGDTNIEVNVTSSGDAATDGARIAQTVSSLIE